MTISEDERIARQLQEEYSAQFREEQRRRSVAATNERPQPFAPPPEEWRTSVVATNERPHLFAPPPVQLSAIPPSHQQLSQEESDAELARVMQQQFREEEEAAARANTSSHGRQQRPPSRTQSTRRVAPSNPPSNTSSHGRQQRPSSRSQRTRREAPANPPSNTSSHGKQQRPPSRSQRTRREAPSNPPSSASTHGRQRRQPSRSLRPKREAPSNPPSSENAPLPSTAPMSDEEIARQLEKRLREQDMAWQATRRSQGEGTAVTSRTTSAVSSDAPEISDEEFAMRLDQQMMDEEVARRLTAEERTRARATAQRNQRKCTCCRVIRCLIPFAIVAGGVAAFVWWIGPENVPDLFIPSPEDFFREDPFSGFNSSVATRWYGSRGNGLSLPIWNALGEDWQPTFSLAVKNWDEGFPDALTLSTVRQPEESMCLPVDGVMKVCNGDYGETRWRGLNEVLISRPQGFIVASTAKMNEFYLNGRNTVSRLYTMCHELGHGFGLGHTDENFYNRDLGNCMDYTSNPQKNEQPDESNFKFLFEMYGQVPGSTPYNSNPDDSGNRNLAEPKALPKWLLEARHDAVLTLETQLDGKEHRNNGWQVLHRSSGGEAHEFDLGQGYFLQIHKLLVPPDQLL